MVQANFFSDLYESYRQRYEQYRSMVEDADFHPVQDVKNAMAHQFERAEESAMATATSMYERVVQPGSNMDKQISAVSQKAHTQLTEAWNSVKGVKERLKTAQFLSKQRQSLVQQLRGNRAMLARMMELRDAVNSKQMAALMRKITESTDALHRSETRAKEAFFRATGVLSKNFPMLQASQEPTRFAKYSHDPLLGVATYPFAFHLLVLGFTEIPLRIMLQQRGFERRSVGPVTYYYHAGSQATSEMDGDLSRSEDSTSKLPVVFIHGIGEFYFVRRF